MTRLRVPVRLRWSDMDAYGHVNNVEMLRLLEEARIEAFWAHPPVSSTQTTDNADDAAGTDSMQARGPRPDGARAHTTWPTAVLDAGPGAQTFTLIARQEIEYLHPLGYRRAPITVEMWIGQLGGASLDVCYEVQEPDGEPGATPYARACTTVVLVDAATGRPRRITPQERQAWLPYIGEPVRFRHRGR